MENKEKFERLMAEAVEIVKEEINAGRYEVSERGDIKVFDAYIYASLVGKEQSTVVFSSKIINRQLNINPKTIGLENEKEKLLKKVEEINEEISKQE